MYIIEVATGQHLEVALEEVTAKDFEIVKKLGRFGFDWDDYKSDIVYKLVLTGTNNMEGLIALVDHSKQGFRN